jgi:hypothetical protein
VPIAQKELFSKLFPGFSSRVEDAGHFFKKEGRIFSILSL